MNTKLKIISILSALCFLGSITCFSAAAADMLNKKSADEDVAPDPGYTEPAAPAVDPGYTEPTVPAEPAVDPGYTEPTVPAPAVDPGYTEPTDPAVDPGYTESTYVDPGTTVDPNGGTVSYAADPGYTESTYADPGTTYYSQPAESYSDNTYTNQYSTYNYADATQQYNQYLYNTYQAQYDDNYIYMPEYEEPAESLVSTASKPVDTDELSSDDWSSIMLDLSNGDLDGTAGAQTFSFIKDNESEGDTDMRWIVYLGTALIIAAVLLIIYVIVTTMKKTAKEKEYFYA